LTLRRKNITGIDLRDCQLPKKDSIRWKCEQKYYLAVHSLYYQDVAQFLTKSLSDSQILIMTMGLRMGATARQTVFRRGWESLISIAHETVLQVMEFNRAGNRTQ